MWKRLIALAVTLPATITIASAQAAQDADIAAYSQDLARRIALGRQTGQLSQANYNSVQALYNNVEMIRRGIGNRAMNPMIRQNMMTSLTNLDKQLTGYLKDDVNARYQMWDPSRRSWRNNWWQADNSGANSFNQEIDAYQNSLKERIDRGRASGRITRSELAQLSTEYDNIDRAQQQYRIGGFSSYERNSLMSMLTQLDRNITAQMRDEENSHYRNWNPNGNSWKDSWWKRPGTASFPGSSGSPNFPGNRPDGGRDGWRPGESGEHGNWNRGDANRPDWSRGENSTHGDWNRGRNDRPDWSHSNSNRPDWNRGNSGRPEWNRNDWNRPSTSSTPSSNSSSSSSSNPSSNSSSSSNSNSNSNSGNRPSTGGTATGNPPVVTPPAQTTPPSSTSPSSSTPPSAGGTTSPGNSGAAGTPPTSGNTGAGTGSNGGRGNWGGQTGEGRGPRTGEGGGRTWGGSGSTRPQN